MTPRKLRSPCAEPGCATLTRTTRCERHSGAERRRYDRKRGTSAQRGYGARHREWRDAVLARDPRCRGCGAPPDPADHADHIQPVKEGGARFDLRNGQRLCPRCHNVKTARERVR